MRIFVYFFIGVAIGAGSLLIIAKANARTRPLLETTGGTATKKPTPTPSPTATPVPTPIATSQEVNGFIDRFSAQYGVDPNVLRHTAQCESGFNPGATNESYLATLCAGKLG